MGNHRRKNRKRTQPTYTMDHSTTVIRQPVGYRIFSVIFFLLSMGIWGVIWVLLLQQGTESAGWMGVMFFVIPTAIELPTVLWFTTWKITLHEQGISKALVGCTVREYTWGQVQRVENFFPYGQYDYIYILFSDGRKLSFRTDCHNADRARRILLSRFSVILTGRHQVGK